MSFERFKEELRGKSINELYEELEKRQKELFKWNNPVERTITIGSINPSTKRPITYSKHPFKKLKKEIAIIRTRLHEINKG